jgi:hypothetical protein
VGAAYAALRRGAAFSLRIPHGVTDMKTKLLLLICLLSSKSAFGGSSAREIAVHFAIQPNSLRWNANHTSLEFMCRVVIENQTHDSLSISNLFQDRAGLCMKVADTNGNELARLISPPFKIISSTIGAGTNSISWPYYGILGRFDPGTNKTVRLQLQGKLLGSSYTKQIFSDIVDMKVP